MGNFGKKKNYAKSKAFLEHFEKYLQGNVKPNSVRLKVNQNTKKSFNLLEFLPLKYVPKNM